MIRRGEIDYLCIKSAEITAKAAAKVIPESYSEAIPKEKREIPSISYGATFKIILFGDPEVSKTELTQRFLTNLFVSDSKMTIGVDFEVKSIIVDGKKVKLQIWDFGGQERFRSLLSTYVRGAKGGLFIYDVANYSTLAHIDDWLEIIRREIKEEDHFPILVVGIMLDEEDEREVSPEEAIRVAESRDVDGFIECNLKTGENVEKVFEALTSLMLEGD